jgi:ribonuclease P protein component
MNVPVRPLTQAADFERVLKVPSKARTPHFAVHHVQAVPARRQRPASAALVPELPTGSAPSGGDVVDNPSAPTGHWLGTVVPKRLARRAVTRNLVKRQMREALRRHAGELPGGLWLMKLRAAFDPREFRSAASDALRACVRAELDALLARAAQR